MDVMHDLLYLLHDSNLAHMEMGKLVWIHIDIKKLTIRSIYKLLTSLNVVYTFFPGKYLE